MCTRQSRKVIWDMINNVYCRAYFCYFPLALANVRHWPFVPFFQFSMKNSEIKTTHNTFRDDRVHIFSTTFLEILYIQPAGSPPYQLGYLTMLCSIKIICFIFEEPHNYARARMMKTSLLLQVKPVKVNYNYFTL